MTPPRLLFVALLVAATLAAAVPAPAVRAAPAASGSTLVSGPYVLLSWNDLGMHCMNRIHATLSVLPPYNNLDAQLIRRGDATRLPQVVSQGVTVEYSFPGNTTSVTKTDFWTHAFSLFGVNLPPDVGLTGLGLAGSMSVVGPRFRAEGIPLTPYLDATPTVESPYQQALLIARDGGGTELARSHPVAPVSVELSCVSAGCHASEQAIVQAHELVAGYDPQATPILCAGCHADPALGTTGRPDAGTFSFRIHDQHKFMDEDFTGTDLCYKCHPGHSAKCLRGVMNHRFGMVCQDCHGSMVGLSNSIETGRTPWLEEPACRDCHTERFGEPAGQLFRVSTGHGGVMCEGCHNSTHAEWPSFRPEDNDNVLALQETAGPLGDCRVCHGVVPADPGPHGVQGTTDVADEVLAGGAPMQVWPNPMRVGCRISFTARHGGGGTLVIFDAQGRTVCLLRPGSDGPGEMRVEWDGRDHGGRRVRPGQYFARWQQRGEKAAARITVVD